MGWLDNAHSFSASVLRGTRGLVVRHPAKVQPEVALELYEFESCPFCRKVREVLSEMDLDYISRPCGRGSANRERAIEFGGRGQFPFLIDPNHDVAMDESEDIIDYLADTYGRGRSPIGRALSPVNTLTSGLASAVRPLGRRAQPGAAQRVQPAQLLELYGFEGSPYCRKVREVLCGLNLDYRVHNVAKGSPRRKQLVELGGRVMVPYLVDPNNTARDNAAENSLANGTGIGLYESDDIIAYLRQQYG